MSGFSEMFDSDNEDFAMSTSGAAYDAGVASSEANGVDDPVEVAASEAANSVFDLRPYTASTASVQVPISFSYSKNDSTAEISPLSAENLEMIRSMGVNPDVALVKSMSVRDLKSTSDTNVMVTTQFSPTEGLYDRPLLLGNEHPLAVYYGATQHSFSNEMELVSHASEEQLHGLMTAAHSQRALPTDVQKLGDGSTHMLVNVDSLAAKACLMKAKQMNCVSSISESAMDGMLAVPRDVYEEANGYLTAATQNFMGSHVNAAKLKLCLKPINIHDTLGTHSEACDTGTMRKNDSREKHVTTGVLDVQFVKRNACDAIEAQLNERQAARVAAQTQLRR